MDINISLFTPGKAKVLSDIESNDGGDARRNVSAEQEGTVDSVDDEVLQHLLQKRGEESFKSLEDIDPFIAEYKKVSGNDLKMKKSSLDLFCLYICKGHTSDSTRSLLGNKRMPILSTQGFHDSVEGMEFP